MPTYSYACTECGDRFDKVQAFTDDALTTCEKCSGRLRKLFNSVGVVFKGSGFYRTDSREAGQEIEKSFDERIFVGFRVERLGFEFRDPAKASRRGSSEKAAAAPPRPPRPHRASGLSTTERSDRHCRSSRTPTVAAWRNHR